MRFTQQWQCRACSHVSRRVVVYPKHGPDTTPLSVLARRGRCTHCGKRGSCSITEWKSGTPPAEQSCETPCLTAPDKTQGNASESRAPQLDSFGPSG